jgi:hypothetical protein
MVGPRIAERYKYMTLPQAAKRLGLHPAKLRRRLKHDVFPPPTFINEYGLNFFDEDWLGCPLIIWLIVISTNPIAHPPSVKQVLPQDSSPTTRLMPPLALADEDFTRTVVNKFQSPFKD